MALLLVSRADSDLCRVLERSGVDYRRALTVQDALDQAGPGDGLLVLADDYPQTTKAIAPELYDAAAAQGMRLYVEYPDHVPGIELAEARPIEWERTVVASKVFVPGVEQMQILMIHGCYHRQVVMGVSHPGVHLVLARVAGYDRAVYGLPETSMPVLVQHPGRAVLVATTCLSQFVTGRYAPIDAWCVVWRWILGWACPDQEIPPLTVESTVHPAYGPDDLLPVDAELQAVRRGAEWYGRARLFIDADWHGAANCRLATYPDGTGPGPEPQWRLGDGRLGMLEGASSRIHADGRQDWRYHVRADCVGEASMALALGGALFGDVKARAIATNLNDFIYEHSVFAQGPRADPASPSYGLISWATAPPADGVYYGDDNARSMLGTIAAAALLDSRRWDEPVMRCLLANLRTTGAFGFRGGRLEEADLQAQGWRHFWETERTHYAPHYESWLWACFLWAYSKTGFAPFLDRASRGIRMTIEAYPQQWRWTNGIQQERARMLLPLAWLVRLADTPEHRRWLRQMADDLLLRQDAVGAIGEEVGSAGQGQYGPPKANEAYGTSEAPLIQRNGDPLSDLLYTTNFAFVGLHEASVATGDSFYRAAEDRLADFLCRIQIRSEVQEELDGGWFRAFDHRRWAYWASNADAGWGAWSIESGWTQAWITSVLAFRQLGVSYWDLTSGSRIGSTLTDLLPVMLPGVV